jgi:hypothetical protein
MGRVAADVEAKRQAFYAAKELARADAETKVRDSVVFFFFLSNHCPYTSFMLTFFQKPFFSSFFIFALFSPPSLFLSLSLSLSGPRRVRWLREFEGGIHEEIKVGCKGTNATGEAEDEGVEFESRRDGALHGRSKRRQGVAKSGERFSTDGEGEWLSNDGS